MYILIYILLLAMAIYIYYRGYKSKKVGLKISGVFLGLLTVLFFGFMNWWGEKLWFDEMQYINRFWIAWSARISLIISGAAISAIFIFLLTRSFSSGKQLKKIIITVGAIIGGIWWFNRWDIVLQFWNRVSTDVYEPILNLDTGFYLFTLPFLNALYGYLLVISLISLGGMVLNYMKYSENDNSQNKFIPFDRNIRLSPYNTLFLSLGIVIIILGLGRYLNRYELLYSFFGTVSGVGWTDDNIRLPMLTTITLITVIFGMTVMIPSIRQKMQGSVNRKGKITETSSVLIYSSGILGLWLLLLVVLPALIQWLRVEPNEITFEKEYIANNIEFTRSGFHINKVEVKEYPVKEKVTKQEVIESQELFDNIRLWDYRALDAVFRQFQEIRLYYEFPDVDIDRYHIDGSYREVMIAPRELEIKNLPSQSQTFVNKRFKYTHGYGITLTKVNEFTREGLPNLLIKDIPPKTKYSSLKVQEPAIYYGELTRKQVVVNSQEKEFDYPSGDKNMYTNYKGKGGVQLSNLWRKFLFGWKFDGTRFFLSGYPDEDSRIMFHRQIKDRVKTLAPFLAFDDDPYIVMADGKLYWIIDAYTTSKKYPYSEPFSAVEKIEYKKNLNQQSLYNDFSSQLKGINYIRNSVKIVVDAYNGKTDFYVFEEEDPLIQVYQRIFPDMFKNKEEMPSNLRSHVRYPSDLLTIQGLVYAKYHMTDPVVFYNQEDLWVRATEKYYDYVQPVEPYYIMWKQKESKKMEFVLILPFTPKNRQVLIGWIAGMCDNENYGRFLAYKFPKEKRVIGPQQVETKIDQDSFLSGQLTLWDQRGSNVIRGNVLAIPFKGTILYVEPIYLQSETAAYPELRLIALMHNDQLSYADNFSDALDGLFREDVEAKDVAFDEEDNKTLIKRASRAFNNYLENMQKHNFEKAGNNLKQLEQSLNELSDQE